MRLAPAAWGVLAGCGIGPRGGTKRLFVTRMASGSEGIDATQAAQRRQGIAEAISSVRSRVQTAAASREDSGLPLPRLVAVSKTKPVEDLMAAYDAGQRIFGENYAQELLDKAPIMPSDVQWRFIGHLQSNKAKALVASIPNLIAVEAVDSAKVADKLSAACQAALAPSPPSSPSAAAGGEAEGLRRTIDLEVFVQVDTSGEANKSGVDAPADATELCRHIAERCPGLKLRGLMTIGAPGDMGCFDRLRACRDEVAAALGVAPQELELSMGMSDDFEEAIRRGSTNVRVGSTIFGARDYSKK